MKKHPYKCTRCSRRKSLPPGTQNGTEKCQHCGTYSMALDKCRLNTPDKSSGGPRCDCNGPKARKEDKIQYRDGVPIVYGPHRKGQLGCQHYKGKIDWPETYESPLMHMSQDEIKENLAQNFEPEEPCTDF